MSAWQKFILLATKPILQTNTASLTFFFLGCHTKIISYLSFWQQFNLKQSQFSNIWLMW
jgi:hypothetical protein